MSKTYDATIAQQLLELAFAGWEYPPFEIRPDGIYQSDAHRKASPVDEVFDWTPACDMTWADAPNPLAAPMLPLPFTAAELAAFMLDGAGAMIPDALECRLGGDVAQSAMLPEGLRHRMVREALQEAYALAAQAIGKVGEFDYEEQARAHALMEQYEEADDEANKREGVFEAGATEDERRERRARAVASVAGLKEQARQAQREVKTKWFTWRKAMVGCLLADEAPDDTEREAAFFEGFYGDELRQWVDMSSVTPNEAAQFLTAKNPMQEPGDDKTQMLARVFEDENVRNPANRTMLDWLDVARSRGAGYDEGAANFVEVHARGKGAPLTAAPAAADSESMARGWTVTKPQRYHGYTAPLYRLITAAHREGKSCPTARDVVEAWRADMPPEVSRVLADGIDYYNAKGDDTKTADLEAIRKRIGRMTRAL